MSLGATLGSFSGAPQTEHRTGTMPSLKSVKTPRLNGSILRGAPQLGHFSFLILRNMRKNHTTIKKPAGPKGTRRKKRVATPAGEARNASTQYFLVMVMALGT